MLVPILFIQATIGTVDLKARDNVRIGNFLVGAPCGIAFVVRDRAAFVVDTGGPYVAGTAAPDDSYHRQTFLQKGAWITLEWGRVGVAVCARLRADRPTVVTLGLSSGWPDFHSRFRPTSSGAVGRTEIGTTSVTWKLNVIPSPVISSPDGIAVPVEPKEPARFVAGIGPLPNVTDVDRTLDAAKVRYANRRPAASGLWGDFVGAIADNLNNSRIYSTDNHRLAHSVSRRWAGGNPNNDPYFCWDSFFNALLASVDDPATARDTVRAILACQTKEGLVPNFGHWNISGQRASVDRSQPPVGSLCVWKMHERRPDLAFLREVYPKLRKWHDWWPQFRDGNHNGLLEWGSATGDWQNAQYETGWDDNLHVAGTRMTGSHMNADAVDLTSMWSMDADYLARIADAVGAHADAVRLRAAHAATNARIDAVLWNPSLGVYCSRFWHPEKIVLLGPDAFEGGFSATYFADETLGGTSPNSPAGSGVARSHDPAIDFNWNGKAPVDGVPANHWSARWTGSLTVPTTGRYRFEATSDDGVRVYAGGRKVIDSWTVHPPLLKTVDIPLGPGRPVPIAVEYFQREGGSMLQLRVSRIEAARPEDAFLRRVTPMNFYPLLAGVPSGERAIQVMRRFTDPRAFWGDWLLPTLSYGDPNYHEQEYWRGDVWGPVNYLLWQGIRQYGSPTQQREFAERSVRLFMRNWRYGVCSENYFSTTGKSGGDPHYTWGALLCLIGLEYVEAHPVQGITLLRIPRRQPPTASR